MRCRRERNIMLVVCVMHRFAADAVAVTMFLQQDEVDKAIKDTTDAIAARADEVDDQQRHNLQHLPHDDNDIND